MATSTAPSTKDSFNAALQSRNNSNHYIAHLKIWETSTSEDASIDPTLSSSSQQRKARYLILAVDKNTGKVSLNKAKRNANGSFSIGKDWDLNLLREVQVYGPDSFSITLSRAYRWQTERPREQTLFLQSLIKVFRKYTGQETLPRVIGLDLPGPTPSSSVSDAPSGRGGQNHSPTRSSITPTGSASKRSILASTSTGTAGDGFYDPRSSSSRSTARQLPPSLLPSGHPQPLSHQASLPSAASIYPESAPITASLGSNLAGGRDDYFSTSTTTAQSIVYPHQPSHPIPSSAAFSDEMETDAYDGYAGDSTVNQHPLPTATETETFHSAGEEDWKGKDDFDRAAIQAEKEWEREQQILRDHEAHQREREQKDREQRERDRIQLEKRAEIEAQRRRVEEEQKRERDRAAAADAAAAEQAAEVERERERQRVKEERKRRDQEERERERQRQLDAERTRPAPIESNAAIASATKTVTTKATSEFGSMTNGARKGSTARSTLGLPQQASARARLSSIEPARGGAAYERMLLAGTGMRNINQAIGEESDDEEQHHSEEEMRPERSGSAMSSADGGYHLDDGSGRKKKKAGRRRSQLDASEAVEQDRMLAMEGARADMMDEDEDATLLNVEEMLEDFEWNSKGSVGGVYAVAVGGQQANAKTADLIEARLLSELQAIEAANIHAIIESDDRVAHVIQHIEQALVQLDVMDSVMAAFKASLNARNDDIAYIEGQNRGLQVQTSNQRVLAEEIEKLLQTIHVDDSTVAALEHAALESADGIADLEAAAAALYKSILQAKGDGIDGERGENVAAATERLAEYNNLAERFCRRVLDFLTWLFNREISELLADTSRQAALQPPHPTVQDHAHIEAALEAYCGILLFVKETSPQLFQRVSAQYFASVSDAYRRETMAMMQIYKSQVRKASEEENNELSFGGPAAMSTAAVLRAGTVRRVGMGLKTKPQRTAGELSGGEAFSRVLASVVPLIAREQAFIADFLHINDTNVTYADYMDLEPFFRRRAATLFSYSAAGPLREMKGALDLIFGFLAPECQALADHVLANDKLQMVSMLAALDRAVMEAEDANNDFLIKTLTKMHMRLATTLEKFIHEQIKAIEQTRLSAKKKKGVMHFTRVFPTFVERTEAQLIGCEMLNIRGAMNNFYEQVAHATFEGLQMLAKMSSAQAATSGDDEKGVLYSQIILLENSRYLSVELSKIVSNALTQILRRADAMFNDALGSYVTSVLRRPLGKMMDFADAVELLMRSTPANEITLHQAYSKSAFKKLAKEYTSKDVRKAIETLAKRVQKHFAADEEDASAPAAAVTGGVAAEEEVVMQVWRSCEDGAAKEVDRFARILKEVLPDGSVSIETSAQEVRKLFTAGAASLKRR